MKTIEQIARDIAETATLSDTQNPETGAHEPVIKDLGQLAAFIEDGIRADRAQLLHGDGDCRSCGHASDCSTHNEPALPTGPCDCKRRIPATSASDRYDAARALLAEWDAAAEPDDLGLHNAGGFGMHQNARIREVLRALVEHPEVSETANDAAMRVWGSKASADLVIATRPHHAEVIALLEAMWHAGINAGWESWEPENAPGMVDTRETYTLASLDGTDDAAEWVHVGYVLDASDVAWLRGLEIVR